MECADTRGAICTALASLSRTRPIFHSEADFQHALAWELHRALPDVSVRLEVPLAAPKGVLDLLLIQSTRRVGIELKYGRGLLTCYHAGEKFCLPAHPLPVVRYEFWQDVERLQHWVENRTLTEAFALCLSNNPGCWMPGNRATTQDQIRFHDSLCQSGTLALDPRPRSDEKFASIALTREYVCSWKEYSRVSDARCGAFRYLLLDIG